MRILLTHVEVTNYALACWRRLAAVEGVDLRVVAGRPGGQDVHNGLHAPEDDPEWLTYLERDGGDPERVNRLAATFRPDVVFIAGWRVPAFTQFAFRRYGAALVLAMDTSLHRPVRQVLGRIWLSRFLRVFDGFLVPGERGREFLVRWWRIPAGLVRTGLYAVDGERWRAAYDARISGAAWPARFQFVGRYVESKGVRELVTGYQRYRRMVADPFPLRCCGAGPLKAALDVEGIDDRGFTQPRDLAGVFSEAGCFVLPSLYDPWPLAVVEASAAGLPMIVSGECGSSVELLRNSFNGYVVRTPNARQIARALVRMHERYSEWPAMGSRSLTLAAPYTPEHWARAIVETAADAVDRRLGQGG